MRTTRIGMLAVTASLLAVPAVALAAHAVSPANGKFTGHPHYKYRSTAASGTLTITVAKHKIAGAELRGKLPPLDGADSHGNACGAVNEITTKGYKVKGSVSAHGKFHYTFTQSFKYQGTLQGTDTITLGGQFKSAKHATGTFRDVSNYTAASAPGKAHCDSGKVKFTVTHR